MPCSEAQLAPSFFLHSFLSTAKLVIAPDRQHKTKRGEHSFSLVRLTTFHFSFFFSSLSVLGQRRLLTRCHAASIWIKLTPNNLSTTQYRHQ
jgi:hypothetical protein